MDMETIVESWRHVQYRGDARDIRELYQKYELEGFLGAREAGEGLFARGGTRRRLLKDGVVLNAVLAPRIYGLAYRVFERLQVGGDFEVFCLRDPEVNAFAQLDFSRGTPSHLIGITSGALEGLDDLEIRSLLGHELGHFLFGHNRLLGLCHPDPTKLRATVLPYLGECQFLQWRKKSEISADRIGLLASGSFEASARALIKAVYGLSERNLDLNVDALLEQIENIREQPEVIEAAYRSHPLLPLRLKALLLFSAALELRTPEAFERVNDEVDTLFGWYRRYPRQPLQEAIMRIIGLAGLELIGVEGELDDEEVRSLVYVLHQHFTDAPEQELVLDPVERGHRWTDALARLTAEGEDSDRAFIIARLAEIALADGKLLEPESGVILEVAQQIGMSARSAYAIIVGAAQSIGFRGDPRVRQLAGQLRADFVKNAFPML